jgi:hypothetical protein
MTSPNGSGQQMGTERSRVAQEGLFLPLVNFPNVLDLVAVD